MRAAHLLLLVLLLPPAAATPATEPYAFEARLDDEPIVGRTMTLAVRIDAHAALDAPIRLEVPDWIAVEGEREQHARVAQGGSVEHAWRLTPQRAGFWRASLSVDASRAEAYGDPVDPAASWQPMGGCCVYAWSAPRDGLSSMSVYDAVPLGAPGEMRVSFAPLDEERAQMTVSVEPRADWLAGEEIGAQIPMGSEPVRRPGDAMQQFVRGFVLAPGNGTVVSPATYAYVTFDDGLPDVDDHGFARDIACANIQVERDGDEVRETSRWSCFAMSAKPRLIPGPGLLAVGIALLSAKGLSTRR